VCLLQCVLLLEGEEMRTFSLKSRGWCVLQCVLQCMLQCVLQCVFVAVCVAA